MRRRPHRVAIMMHRRRHMELVNPRLELVAIDHSILPGHEIEEHVEHDLLGLHRIFRHGGRRTWRLKAFRRSEDHDRMIRWRHIVLSQDGTGAKNHDACDGHQSTNHTSPPEGEYGTLATHRGAAVQKSHIPVSNRSAGIVQQVTCSTWVADLFHRNWAVTRKARRLRSVNEGSADPWGQGTPDALCRFYG